MCLFTDQNQPKIAKEDILVFKLLNKNKTPYRHKRVFFLFGRAHMQSQLKIECFDQFENRVFIGLHSFNDVTKAEVESSFIGSKIYNAVIPKGSMYVMSTDNDEIASNKLIIFKRYKDYLKSKYNVPVYQTK